MSSHFLGSRPEYLQGPPGPAQCHPWWLLCFVLHHCSPHLSAPSFVPQKDHTTTCQGIFLPAVCSSSPLTLLPTHHHHHLTHTHTHTFQLTIMHPLDLSSYFSSLVQPFLIRTTWVRSSVTYFRDTIFLFFKVLISPCIYIFLELLG